MEEGKDLRAAMQMNETVGRTDWLTDGLREAPREGSAERVGGERKPEERSPFTQRFLVS